MGRHIGMAIRVGAFFWYFLVRISAAGGLRYDRNRQLVCWTEEIDGVYDAGPNLKGPYVSAYRTRHLSCKLTVYLGGALLTARHSDFSGAVRSRAGRRNGARCGL